MSFKGKLNFESKKSIMTLRKKFKRLIKQSLSALAQVIFMGLGKFAENIYYGNLPLKIMKKKYGRND